MNFKVNKSKEYTFISNNHLLNKELSLKAKGILTLMLSLPDTWDFSIASLTELSRDGRDSVMVALQELESFNYLKRTKALNDKKQFIGYDYEVYEKPYTEKPNTENPDTVEKKSNTKEKNDILNLISNKSIDLENKEKENILKEKERKELQEEAFEKWWKLYPRKTDKKRAKIAYLNVINGTIESIQEKSETIYNALLKQVKEDYSQREMQFVPLPTTWLHGEKWNDMIIKHYNKRVVETPTWVNDYIDKTKEQKAPMENETDMIDINELFKTK